MKANVTIMFLMMVLLKLFAVGQIADKIQPCGSSPEKPKFQPEKYVVSERNSM
ncbi:MAG: hypothetical protein ACLTNP_06810 [Streptococcus salivarius]